MHIRWMIFRLALVIPLGLACSRRSNTDLGGTDSAVVNIVATGAGFDVSLIRERKTLATWHETTLDGYLGKRVDDTLDKHPTLGVLFCGSSTVSLKDLHAVSSGLPRTRDVVFCLPDRKNCPNSCP